MRGYPKGTHGAPAGEEVEQVVVLVLQEKMVQEHGMNLKMVELKEPLMLK